MSERVTLVVDPRSAHLYAAADAYGFVVAERPDSVDNDKQDVPEAVRPFGTAPEPPEDRWVSVKARGLARYLISQKFPADIAFELVAALPDAPIPRHVAVRQDGTP
jgi:hypothetical protein